MPCKVEMSGGEWHCLRHHLVDRKWIQGDKPEGRAFSWWLWPSCQGEARRPEVRGNEREWSLRLSENQESVVYKKPRKMKPKEIRNYRDQ